MTTAQIATAKLSPAAASQLQRVLRDAGWSIDFVDLDLTGDKPKADIRLMRDDGRWIHARVDSIGRATMERFQRERYLGMTPNTKGRRPLSPQVDDEFLGRSKCASPREMLDEVSIYLCENALQAVALADVRAGWAELMSSPRLLGWHTAPAHAEGA